MTQYLQVKIIHMPMLQQSCAQGKNSWATVRIEIKPDETYILFHSQTWKGV